MAEKVVDQGRRRFLTATTAVVGGIGGICAAVPFYTSWKPSAKAVAAGAPVDIDISKLEVGQQLVVGWRKRPVWIIKRPKTILDTLASLDGRLKDPACTETDQQPSYAKNQTRSIKPDILVLVGSCTHLGCSPKMHMEIQPEPWDSQWKGGFYCPCHNSRFDMAGRVFQGSPAPTNLVVPPYHFEGDNKIVIGVDPSDNKGAA
jgi:ubiquinol-cytochrome c reductase iron-sulfur subunit